MAEMGMIKEFKEFAMRGNVVDMAVGIIIGAAFGSIVQSLVADVIMPPIGFVLGNVDFSNLFITIRDGAAVVGPYVSLADAQKAGAVTINYGMFANKIISFLIVAFAVFMLVRGMNKMIKKEQPPVTTKDCPYCFTAIPLKALRCPHCTSELKA
jgi:large conductance mechanosensitive channel